MLTCVNVIVVNSYRNRYS